MITGSTMVAGVVGSPVKHSLSPLIHNAWLSAAGLDGVYVAFSPPQARFAAFVQGLRGGVVRGLNITLPFKEEALREADEVSHRADLADAANLLVFGEDGRIVADNTDGLGLLHAFAAQAPGFDVEAGPVVILGAGGAAKGAAAAFADARAPEIRIVNRTFDKADRIARKLGSVAAAFPLERAADALDGAIAVVNATSAGLADAGEIDVPLEATPPEAVVMDMVYKPLVTPFLARAQALGRRTVDGLEMLIGQAAPSFRAMFGAEPPASVDVRGLCLQALEGK